MKQHPASSATFPRHILQRPRPLGRSTTAPGASRGLMALANMLPVSLPCFRRDLTVAVVGATSWAAVAWKIGRTEREAHNATEAVLALVSGRRWRRRLARLPPAAGWLPAFGCWASTAGTCLAVWRANDAKHLVPPPPAVQLAALLCLWPLVLGMAPKAAYTRWREWLVPAHLAAQHLVGLHFTLPTEVQQSVVRAGGAAAAGQGGGEGVAWCPGLATGQCSAPSLCPAPHR